MPILVAVSHLTMEIAAEYNSLAAAYPKEWRGVGLMPRQDRFAGMSKADRNKILAKEAEEYMKQFSDPPVSPSVESVNGSR